MTPVKNLVDRWPVYIAGGFISFGGIMMFSIMPVVVAALQRHYGFKEGQLGDIVGCYFAGVVLVSLTTFAWIRKVDFRVTALLGQVISAVAFLLTMTAGDYVHLSLLMGAAGIGGGITYALIFTLLGDSDDPDRAFGINMFFQASLSTVMIMVLPMIFANDASDTRRMAWVIGGTVGAITLGVFFLPKSARKGGSPAIATAKTSATPFALPLYGTAATFLIMMACTAPWVFIEQEALAKRLEPQFVGLALGAAQFVSIFGSVVAAVMSDRFGKFVPVCIATAIFLSGIYLLRVFHSPAGFVIASCVFLLPTNFLLVFSLGLTAELDTGGRFIGLSTSSLCGPSLVAPSIAGRLYERYGFVSNLWIGVVTLLLGVGLYCLLLKISRDRTGKTLWTMPESTRRGAVC